MSTVYEEVRDEAILALKDPVTGLYPNGTEWPYRMELMEVERLFLDPGYQRPPQLGFIARLLQSFDESLVSTLDVASRSDGRGAVMDGVQRLEMIRKVGKSTVWCAVYDGLTVADEARFFYRRNRDRKNVHPYYQFNAKLLMNDPAALAIAEIVRHQGFKLGIAANADDSLTAIRSIEDAYSFSSVARDESLSPTLHLIKRSIYGRKNAKDAAIISGFARFFQPFYDEEIDFDQLVNMVAETGPALLIGRAKDKVTGRANREAFAGALAREMIEAYNRRVAGPRRLSARLITTRLRAAPAKLPEGDLTSSQRRDAERRAVRER